MYRPDSSTAWSDATNPGFMQGERFAIPNFSPWAIAFKRGFDIFGALTFFLMFWWLYVFLAIGVRVTSPGGPIVYAQNRVGRKGKVFRFYKFRSMVPNAEEVLSTFLDSSDEAKSEWSTHQKLKRDPRITRFGKFIRRTSLDEFPQMWNVLRGDMSLVGPRPCMLDQERLYGTYWGAYCAMRPGLTGLWQVSGRSRLSYHTRVLLDAQYVRRWSLLKDFQILLSTVRVVLLGDGSM